MTTKHRLVALAFVVLALGAMVSVAGACDRGSCSKSAGMSASAMPCPMPCPKECSEPCQGACPSPCMKSCMKTSSAVHGTAPWSASGPVLTLTGYDALMFFAGQSTEIIK